MKSHGRRKETKGKPVVGKINFPNFKYNFTSNLKSLFQMVPCFVIFTLPESSCRRSGY